MSGKATGWVLANYPVDSQGDRNRKLTFIGVADAANQYGESARVAVEVICAEWGFSNSAVRRHLQELIQDGWLEVEQEARGRGGPKVYRLPRMGAGITAQIERQSDELISARSERQSDALLALSSGNNQPKLSANTGEHTYISNNGSYGNASASVPLLDAFPEWYAVYPRHEDKKRAEKCYLARRREGIPAETLLTAARQYAAEKADTEQRFIKMPSTFLAKDGPWVEAYHRRVQGLRGDGDPRDRDLTAIQAAEDARIAAAQERREH